MSEGTLLEEKARTGMWKKYAGTGPSPGNALPCPVLPLVSTHEKVPKSHQCSRPTYNGLSLSFSVGATTAVKNLNRYMT